jgi:competence ComEA-like helix-hairpin-helix protein
MLEGIGKVTAHRIVEYREKAGGFKSLAQLKDVKGLSGKKFAKLENNLTLFKKSDLKVLVDINSAPLSALRVLPRISKKLAMSIIDYRERNRGFKVLEDLLKIEGVGMGKFKELQNFVTVRPFKVVLKEKP